MSFVDPTMPGGQHTHAGITIKTIKKSDITTLCLLNELKIQWLNTFGQRNSSRMLSRVTKFMCETWHSEVPPHEIF